MVENDIKNLNIFSKLFRRLCRSLTKIVFPNCLRIFSLRKAGVRINRDVIINEGFTLACDIGSEENLVIEDRVAIGPNVTTIITSHPNFSRLKNLKSLYPCVNVNGKIHIKNDAWIGAGCIILPDIRIGEYSIVGAGSVVTKDVPPYTIVAGVPAKILRSINKEKYEDSL